MLFNATAAGSTARGTISPTDACQAGPFSAAPQPMRKVKSSSSHGVIMPRHAKAVSAPDTTSMKICAAIISLRRS